MSDATAPLPVELAASDWERGGCPLCHAGPDRSVLAYAFEASSYRHCGGCGLVYLSPRVREERMLALYRSGDYFSGQAEFGYETYEADAACYHRTFERRLDEIRPFRSGGRLLDIGCGTGLLVEVALGRGYDAYGLDASDYAIASRSADLGGRLRVGTLADAELPAASFDVVTLMDVFEHVYDPRGFVGALERVLAPGGIVAIATPDYASWMRRLLGRRSVSFKIPEHVAYYTRDTLAAATAAHFEILGRRAIGQYCTTDFLERRLAQLAPVLGRAFGAVVRGLGAGRLQPYVPSGSLLAILGRRRDGPGG